MRADRLLSLMLLLQRGGRLKARELAARLEVSERTIHRDVEALSRAGVPVYSERGRHGGAALLDGWRAPVTGLSESEAGALAAIGVPRALGDIQLSGPLRSGLVKLAEALPEVQRRAVERARQRIHIDPSGWFESGERVPHLQVLRDAVWQDRSVRLAYRDFEGHRSRRVVEPLGLVIKLERWYLVAGTARGPSVFRGSRVERAALLERTFERPRSFDLAAFWREWSGRFDRERGHYPVTLALDAEAEAALRRQWPASLLPPPAPKPRSDRRRIEVDFERASIAQAQVVALGPGAEVVRPAELRRRLRRLGEALRRAHAERPGRART